MQVVRFYTTIMLRNLRGRSISSQGTTGTLRHQVSRPNYYLKLDHKSCFGGGTSVVAITRLRTAKDNSGALSTTQYHKIRSTLTLSFI